MKKLFDQNKPAFMFIAVSSFMVLGLLLFLFFMTKNKNNLQDNTTIENNSPSVYIDSSGKQIIDITAKNGFSPASINAKANTPTTLKVRTENTFSCTSVVNIPALGISKSLPPTNVTDIEIPPQKPGEKLSGICSTGSYNFTINFN